MEYFNSFIVGVDVMAIGQNVEISLPYEGNLKVGKYVEMF